MGADESTPTGRLFRSLRAEGDVANAAVPALALDEAIGLRTVTLGEPLGPPVAAPVVAAAVVAPEMESPTQAVPVPSLWADDDLLPPTPTTAVPIVPIVIGATPTTSEGAAATTSARAPGAHAARGVRATGIWLIVIGVTVVVAFGDALLFRHNGLSWLTGVALLLASIYAAIVVRPEDSLVAVIAPPIAFFLATITAGQLTLQPAGSVTLREAYMILTTLGANAAWIFGSTAAALVIVLVRAGIRRRRSSAVSAVL